MRIPGEGTDRLINRRQEAAVYQAIRGKSICDDVVYMNPEMAIRLQNSWIIQESVTLIMLKMSGIA